MPNKSDVKKKQPGYYRQALGRYALPYTVHVHVVLDRCILAGAASLLDHLWDTESCNTSAISDLGWFVVTGRRFLGTSSCTYMYGLIKSGHRAQNMYVPVRMTSAPHSHPSSAPARVETEASPCPKSTHT